MRRRQTPEQHARAAQAKDCAGWVDRLRLDAAGLAHPARGIGARAACRTYTGVRWPARSHIVLEDLEPGRPDQHAAVPQQHAHARLAQAEQVGVDHGRTMRLHGSQAQGAWRLGTLGEPARRGREQARAMTRPRGPGFGAEPSVVRLQVPLPMLGGWKGLTTQAALRGFPSAQRSRKQGPDARALQHCALPRGPRQCCCVCEGSARLRSSG